MTRTYDLKRCPFCGGSGNLGRDGPGGQGHEIDHYIVCTGCGARGKAFAEGWNGSKEETQRKAMAAWNERVSG